MSAPTVIGSSSAARATGGFQNLPSRQGDIDEMMTLLQAMQGSGLQRGPGNLGGSLSSTAQAANLSHGSSTELQKIVGQTADQNRRFVQTSRLRPASRFEIKAGWDIPAVLEQSLNSDLAGDIRALVRENVYDTATGDYLLIPQGSRLVGIYDTRIAYGQDGLTVVWNRIIFPDGSSIDLEGMPGQDAAGRSGLRHDVDNHYKRLIGFAALTSAFSAAFQLSQSRRGGLLAYPSAAETAGSAVGAELSRFGAEVTRRNLNVQPTIKIPVGYRFNVRVSRDLLFEGPYRPFPN